MLPRLPQEALHNFPAYARLSPPGTAVVLVLGTSHSTQRTKLVVLFFTLPLFYVLISLPQM